MWIVRLESERGNINTVKLTRKQGEKEKEKEKKRKREKEREILSERDKICDFCFEVHECHGVFIECLQAIHLCDGSRETEDALEREREKEIERKREKEEERKRERRREKEREKEKERGKDGEPK